MEYLKRTKEAIVFDIFIWWKWLGVNHNQVLWLSWWRHQMETFSALLAICAGNSPVTGEFPAQRPVTRSFDVFFDMCLNERLSNQWWGRWFETPSDPLWHHCNVHAGPFPSHMTTVSVRLSTVTTNTSVNRFPFLEKDRKAPSSNAHSLVRVWPQRA